MKTEPFTDVMNQGWEFAHRSDRSYQMSDCAQFAHIAQDK